MTCSSVTETRRAGRLLRGAAFVVLALALGARPSGAQVSSAVDIRDGHGRALVHNPTASVLRVEIAVWESDETSKPIRLLKTARANVWPQTFELPPSETQVVRIAVPEDAYDAGTLLRLDTRLVPVAAVSSDTTRERAGARIIVATRILSKLLIR